MRRANRRDLTERAIVEALRAYGCKVQPINQGDGAPDLIVADPRGRLYWLEVKSPGGHLTQQQVRWRENWGWPVAVVETDWEALEAVGVVYDARAM